MSYYTPNMAKTSTAVDTRSGALGLQVDPRTQTRIPPMLRLRAAERQEQSKDSGLKINLTPTAAPARLSIYPSDDARVGMYPTNYGMQDDVRPRPVACTQDNLIRQIPRLRESLSALDEEIHSDKNTPDIAETMRIHSKILQLQDKRMNDVEDRINAVASGSDGKTGLFEQLHHVSGKHIMDMSKKIHEIESSMDLHEQLHHATGERVLGMAERLDEIDDSMGLHEQLHHASGERVLTVDRKVRDLTQAGEISRDVLQKCQNKIREVREDVEDVARQVEDVMSVNATNRQLQGEIGQTLRKLNTDMRTASPQRATRAYAAAASPNVSEELLRQLAVSVIDIKKMVGSSSQDVAALSRKVDGMEGRLNKSQLHADTFSLLQRDMLGSQKPRKR